MKESISVILPTFNRADVLERTLRSYIDQAGVDSAEIVVIDDGSTDATQDILRRIARAEVRILHQENRGPAAARNAGLRVAQGDYVMFAGDDVIPTQHLLKEHLLTHRVHGSRSTAVLGNITWSHEQSITPFMRWLEQEGMQFDYSRIIDPLNVPVEMFYTSNLSLRRDFLMEGDLFDERFTAACWEDIDLGMRLRNRGLKIVYNPRASAFHLHSTDFVRFAGRTRRAGYFHALFIEKHNLVVKPRRFFVEALKRALGSVLRVVPWRRARNFGYRWSLSWYEFLGLRKFRGERLNA
jgi:glycosyltransferase involved in cell wall biosynthesis